jgi:hypothetical protein|tara:strand:+ start:52 stop:567 length:516 start_codon:yes stop_codon:yes gene_type:complete
MSLHQLVKKHNISEEIKDINESLLKECLEQRESFSSELMQSGNNFQVNSKHTNFLYNLFYQISNNNLNKFHLTDLNFSLWCYITDKKFNRTNWHNHFNTTTINCVLYLKTQGKGIFFKNKDEELYILPNDGDMLIFPSFLEHLPEASTTEPRITLNLELRCVESAEEIFKI